MLSVMRNSTAGMWATTAAGALGLAVAFGAPVRLAGLAVVLVAFAHADGMAAMHKTLGIAFEGLGTNLAAIGIVAAALRNLEGGEKAMAEVDQEEWR